MADLDAKPLVFLDFACRGRSLAFADKEALQLIGMLQMCHVLCISLDWSMGTSTFKDGLQAAVSNRWRHHCWAMPSLLHFGLLRCNLLHLLPVVVPTWMIVSDAWICMAHGHLVPRLFPKRYGVSCFDLQILKFWSVLMLRSPPAASFLAPLRCPCQSWPTMPSPTRSA